MSWLAPLTAGETLGEPDVVILAAILANVAAVGRQRTIRDPVDPRAVGRDVRIGVAPASGERCDARLGPAAGTSVGLENREVRERAVGAADVGRALIGGEGDEEVPRRRAEDALAEQLGLGGTQRWWSFFEAGATGRARRDDARQDDGERECGGAEAGRKV